MKLWGILAAFGLLALMAAENASSARVFAELGARPVVALTHEGKGEGTLAQRIVIAAPGALPAEGQARTLGGVGISFGTRLDFALPGGEIVACRFRWTWSGCSGGWVPERGGQ